MRVYGEFEVEPALTPGPSPARGRGVAEGRGEGGLGVIIALATAAALGAGNLTGVLRGLALLTLCALLSGFAHARLNADRHRWP